MSMRREIKNLQVYCVFQKRGCEEQMKVRQLQDHIKICRYRSRRCPNGCGTQMLDKQIDYHLKNECKHIQSETDETVPDELEDDPLTRKLYEKAIEEGKEIDKTIRVMVVGCYGQGKTTLVQRLLGQPIKTVESTNGIDIHKCLIAQDGAKWESDVVDNDQDDSMKRLALLAKTSELSFLDFETDLEVQEEVEKCEEFEILEQKDASTFDETFSGINLQTTQTSSSATTCPDEDTSKKSVSDPVQFKKFSSELKKCQSTNSDFSNVKTEHVNIWDFGGQYVFYATHQLFHSRNAIYLLVFKLNEALDTKVRDEDCPDQSNSKMKSMKDYIEFWVNSVHSFVGNEEGTDPPIILVGTHKDKLLDELEADEHFESVRELFDGRKLLYHIQPDTYPVTATNPADDTVEQLRSAVTKIGEKLATKHVIPAKWIPLEKALKDIQNENVITFENVWQIDKRNEFPIGTEDQVKLFLKYHHARGTFFYFDEGEISDFVVVKPQYIIDAFKCIITSRKFCQRQPHLRPLWKRLAEKAVLEPGLLDSTWGNDPENRFMKFKDVLIFFLKRHRIIAEALKYDEDECTSSTPLGFYIVPSLLSTTDSGEIEEFLYGKRCTQVSLLYLFENEAIVSTIFQRLTAAAIGTWPVVCFRGQDMLFEHAGAYKLHMSHIGLMQHVRDKIELLVVHQCPEKSVAPEVPHYFRRFVELMIDQEFMKFRGNDSPVQDYQHYAQAVRCFHERHNCKGSEAMYDLKTLKCIPEKIICCPDNIGHGSLCIAEVLNAWYNQDFRKDIPKRKLARKEYSELSRAIGYEWHELGWHLGIDDVTIQHIEMDNQRTAMRIYEMLLTWDRQEAEEATLDVLIDAIRQIPPKAVNWDIVNNIMDKFY
ncbi:uncharacterized protein LOC123536712 [Mercenaria mercenaria]|uniref:uncharacterized protein LOC123536712 n=1 Tax=Mercenaria mercenaria TaxID=6596 RepID=UPI00234F0566|nr:uncharacterized protein LOC123536712 [Mercenaria mercenaria]